MTTRRKFSSKFKTKVVLELLKERFSLAELAQKYELAPQQLEAGISQWSWRSFWERWQQQKRSCWQGKRSIAQDHRQAQSWKWFFKRGLSLEPLAKRRSMIRKGHTDLSLKAQCNILNIHRSGIYYQPKPESKLNLELMRLMDEHYLHHSYKGAPSMHTSMRR